jgi:hypothetical protein
MAMEEDFSPGSQEAICFNLGKKKSRPGEMQQSPIFHHLAGPLIKLPPLSHIRGLFIWYSRPSSSTINQLNRHQNNHLKINIYGTLYF